LFWLLEWWHRSLQCEEEPVSDVQKENGQCEDSLDEWEINETDLQFNTSLRSSKISQQEYSILPPPISAIRAWLSLHPQAVWLTTQNGWLPLHLTCHVGRMDARSVSMPLDTMEIERELRLKNGG
jgi:hypothetical protein